MAKCVCELPEDVRQPLWTTMILFAHWNVDLFARSEQVARELLAVAPAEQAEQWYWARLLHDLGQLTLPMGIALPSSGVTALAREHPLRGAMFLERLDTLELVVQAAHFHHDDGATLERCRRQRIMDAPSWDGTGYPYDIREHQIPLVARTLAVAEVYVALTTEQGLSDSAARLNIERRAGTQFRWSVRYALPAKRAAR